MQLELVYFNVRARAESILMACAFGKVPIKYTSPNDYFKKSWPEAKKETPWGSLPILFVDGKPLGQTGSINRFVAGLVGLVPSDAVEAARCDSIYEACQDLGMANPLVNVFRGEDHAQRKAAFFSMAPTILDRLEKQCEGPFFLGASPYYCDLAAYHFFSNMRLVEPTAMDKHPKLTAMMGAVEQLPGVGEYLATRPEAVDVGVAPNLVPRQ